MSAPVASEQRFARSRFCWVCGGYPGLPRGQGKRCYGYVSSDGRYCHCTRPEFAHGLPQESGGTFAHLIDGPCNCGQTHRDDSFPTNTQTRWNGPNKHTSNGRGLIAPGPPRRKVVCTRRWRITVIEGELIEHFRVDYDDGSKDMRWMRGGKNGLRGLRVADLPFYGGDAAGDVKGVIIVEGEPARDALDPLARDLNLAVVATITGATTRPSDAVLATLPDLPLYLWPDSDDPGETHMITIATALVTMGRRSDAVRRLVWPDARPGEGDDAADFVRSGATTADLARLDTPAFLSDPEGEIPAERKADGIRAGLNDISAYAGAGTDVQARNGCYEQEWPILDPAALYGLAGDIVREIAPHTEGDPIAILTNTIAMFGSAAGPRPHTRVGASRHPVSEFMVHVGETSRARKGTAYQEVLRLFRIADPEWSTRIMGGLSSGEGLIYAVRDATYKITKDGDEVLDDPGVEDKRLLAVESEFASVLRVASREGNILSELLRRAWDGDTLQTLTRNSPLCATSPHVSLLGHITTAELLRELSETAQANGWANRHMVFCVRRSKLLPHGGALSEEVVNALARRLRHALDAAREQGELRRDAEANRMWENVYPALTVDHPGMLGAITARSEAHVLRLSLVYALLDNAPAIGRPHLEAALALWQYSEESARFIFGDATGDPVADQILRALRANGAMKQTQISELFNRNQKAGRLQQALAAILNAGKVRTWQGESTNGRSPIYWEATS